MATSALLPQIQALNCKLTQFTNAAYAEADIFTGGANGSVVRKIAITSSDTSDRILTLYASDGSQDFIIGTVTVPANAGTNALVAAIGFMANTFNSPSFMVDDNGNYFCYVPNGWKLRASVAQPTADKLITVFVQGGNY